MPSVLFCLFVYVIPFSAQNLVDPEVDDVSHVVIDPGLVRLSRG